MDHKLGVAKWVCIIIIILLMGPTNEAFELWCLQCTWSANQLFGMGNSTSNATGDSLCSIKDLSDITQFPPNPRSPVVNPLCTYEADSEVRLLKGPCYDYACYAQSMSCIKWTTTMEGTNKFVNVTRLCAMAGSDPGCYTQVVDGYQWEVCICNDQVFCNDGQSIHRHQNWLLFVVSVFLIFITWQNRV